MLLKLILLFTTVPLIELAILLKLSDEIGFGYTLALVLVTGVAGAYLAKSQGRQILFQIRYEMQHGNMPGDALINGLCVLIGGAMLLTPGIVTDTLGFILVIPGTREIFKHYLKEKFQRMLQEGNTYFYLRK
ncbi:MAG: FxsA family protein [Bacillota bacterium]